MTKQSAGILAFQRQGQTLRVFLVHPGGPFWAKKDLGAWSIPKGEFATGEDALAAARREFQEETGQTVDGTFLRLTPCPQPSRKVVHAWAAEAAVDAERIESNHFEIEWPPRSGRRQSFPEVDRGAWFDLAEAARRIQPGQIPILRELARNLGIDDDL
jgi:predicted NUDIX family NTP pyrophosphohydrolase